MTQELWRTETDAGRRFPLAAAAEPHRTLLAFDFDGTLAFIRADPQAVEMVEETADALNHLAPLIGQIAIISGRPLSDLVRLSRAPERSGLTDAIIFGHYGAQRLDMASGLRKAPSAPEGVAEAANELRGLLVEWPGASVEEKGLSAAVHVRNTADPDIAFGAIEGGVRDIAERYGLSVEPGRYVWEIRGVTIDKGDALRQVVKETAPLAVAFVGDDVGDLAAFEELVRLREAGVSTCAVVSGSDEAPEVAKHADVLCRGPLGVAAWLNDVAATIELLGAVDH